MRKVTEVQHDYSYEAVEKLDELITARMMCAEQACRNDARLPWSEEIHEKMTQVNILRLYICLASETKSIAQIKSKRNNKR